MTGPLSPGTLVRVAAPLRPSGKVEHGERLHDARSAGEWFDAGASVLVLRADGFGLLVGPTDADPSAVRPRPSEVVDGAGSPTSATAIEGEGTSRAELYLVGLIAFVALGTGIGAVALMLAIGALRSIDVLISLPLFLCGGAAGGAGIYHVGLGLGAIASICRRAGAPKGLTLGGLALIVAAILGIAVAAGFGRS